MEMRVLGTTGLTVSKFCLGAGMFGAFGNRDHDDCVRIVHAALDAGINFVDTSDVYSYGESEEILAKALKGRRQDVVLATKFGLPMSDKPNRAGGSKRWIIQECETSLKRLGTDYIDIYQMHRPDPGAELDDTMGALSDLVRQGKIRLFGSSTFPAELIVEAQWTAERRGRERFRTEQPPYSIFARRIEADVLPTSQRYGMGVLVWSPLAQGWLSGKYRRGQRPNDVHRGNLQPHLFDASKPDVARKYEAIEALGRIASEAGISLMHMALAFVCRHPAVTCAILGPRTMEHLTGALAGADVSLSDEVMDAIDAVVAPGTNVSRDDDGYVAPAVADKSLRRRAGAAKTPMVTTNATERLRQQFAKD